MRNVIRRAALTVLVPAAVAAALTGTAGAASAATATSTLEQQVVAQTNDARVKAGCAKLTVDARLTKAARGHSADMAANHYFDHKGLNGSTFVTRVKAAGYPKPYGENIAWGYKDANGVMTGWMNSPGHRKNIENCKSTTIGVGAARNDKGVLYWTQEFGA